MSLCRTDDSAIRSAVCVSFFRVVGDRQPDKTRTIGRRSDFHSLSTVPCRAVAVAAAASDLLIKTLPPLALPRGIFRSRYAAAAAAAVSAEWRAPRRVYV